jgi:pyruvate,water dikinase
MAVSVAESRTSRQAEQGGDELRRPGRSLRRRINGYSYSATVPEDIPPDVLTAHQEALANAMRTTRARWDAELLPELEADLRYMQGLDLKAASDTELLNYLDEYLDLQAKHWRFHSLVVTPTHTAVEKLADRCRQIMGDAPDDEPYKLVQGLPNKSLETDQAMQDLATLARSDADTADVFAEGQDPASILLRLKGTQGGRSFLERLDGFLTVYGYRPTGFDFLFPGWLEDPTFVVLNIKSYLESPPRPIKAEQDALASESEKYLHRVLDTIGDDSEGRQGFLEILQVARDLWPLKEDHSFYIDQASTACLRILLAEMGQRLSRKGVVHAHDDVFYLTLDEMTSGLDGQAPIDIRTVVAGRKEERQRQMGMAPPPVLGSLPPDGESGDQSPFSRMSGPLPGSRPEENATALRGVSGSRGSATGPAKIVRSPVEFGKVRPGDVLVCTSTSPTWTALFASVAALVSDSGGVLSHTAIVAREYGLPAVVGVKYGTTTISDGQVITVDGDAGVVLLR